jgi:ribosome biogenesis GTPase
MIRAMRARILSHHGRQAWAIGQDGQHRLCVYKGRDHQPAANDNVLIDSEKDPAVITEILPRSNQLIRSEAHRSKILAANVDAAAIVIAGSPPFSDELLARMICACAAEDIPSMIVLNKIDLNDDAARAREQLAPFRAALSALDWPIFELAVKPKSLDENDQQHQQFQESLRQFRASLMGKTTVIMGQSGMGKSSLLNALIPGFNAQTQEISEALQTGRHTTTAGQMVALAPESWVIDTPGFQLFGLHHLSESQLALGFPEWRAAQEERGRCKFFNCHHDHEPGCHVRAAVENNGASARRLSLWQTIRANLD